MEHQFNSAPAKQPPHIEAAMNFSNEMMENYTAWNLYEICNVIQDRFREHIAFAIEKKEKDLLALKEVYHSFSK